MTEPAMAEPTTGEASEQVSRSIRISAFGGPEVLEQVARPVRALADGEARVRVTVAGVNYMDIATRTGFNPTVTLPTTLGVEGSGVIVELDSRVTELSVGQRVAWYYVPGSYTEQLIAPAGALVPIPDDVDDDTAAALLMQGLTAQHLAAYARPGDTALVHSAAGGVGSLLTQLLRIAGVTVIARVSSSDKAPAAAQAGAHHVLIGRGSGFAGQVRTLTASPADRDSDGGPGVDIVYDSAGADTFDDSLATLRSRGIYAYYGGADGEPPPVRLSTLPSSVLLTHPVVMNHVPDRPQLLERCAELFAHVSASRLRPHVSHTYPLARAADAHDALQTRTTTGKLLLRPNHHA